MTRERFYGSDTDFCAWMRACKDLPSSGHDFGFAACDNDITVHRYKTVVDRIGTRDVQALMQIEIKTRGGVPPMSQMDTLSKLNLFRGQKHLKDGQVIRFFGVFVLVMDGTTPTNSTIMRWGSMRHSGPVNDASKLKWRDITLNLLIKLLRFEIDPHSFESEPLRRRHSSQEIIIIRKADLGFEYEEKLRKDS